MRQLLAIGVVVVVGVLLYNGFYAAENQPEKQEEIAPVSAEQHKSGDKERNALSIEQAVLVYKALDANNWIREHYPNTIIETQHPSVSQNGRMYDVKEIVNIETKEKTMLYFDMTSLFNGYDEKLEDRVSEEDNE